MTNQTIKRFVLRIAFLAIVLAGFSCANMKPLATRCPICGWLVEVLGTEIIEVENGTEYVYWYRCYSWSCSYVFTTTNKPAAQPIASPKAK